MTFNRTFETFVNHTVAAATFCTSVPGWVPTALPDSLLPLQQTDRVTAQPDCDIPVKCELVPVDVSGRSFSRTTDYRRSVHNLLKYTLYTNKPSKAV